MIAFIIDFGQLGVVWFSQLFLCAVERMKKRLKHTLKTSFVVLLLHNSLFLSVVWKKVRVRQQTTKH